jgi:hypothetical protein
MIDFYSGAGLIPLIETGRYAYRRAREDLNFLEPMLPDARPDSGPGHPNAAMIDRLPLWIQDLTAGEQRLLAGLMLLAGLLSLAYLFRKSLRHWRETRQITRAVKRLCTRCKRDIPMPDGLGGEIRIDFLGLTSEAILVVGVKRYDGMIFGSTQTDAWTQTVNSRSYKFPNPDTYLAQQISAVRNIVPKATVRGLHLFTDSAVFPWDKPPNVLQIKDLRSSGRRRPGKKDIPADLRAAWSQLLQSMNR